MKSNSMQQDRLVKQNEISRQRLEQEIVKLEKVEKSDLRMMETVRHRFRTRHKNLNISEQSSGSNAINVRMYETHNPGFCYHCTGAIKEIGRPIKEHITKDCYEFVRSIVFTKDEVDPDKVLCLHLLTAHSPKWNNIDSAMVKPVSPLLEEAKNKPFSGAWNNVLPCYVVVLEEKPTDMKLHENPAEQCLEEQTIREFEEKYKQYVENNTDFNNNNKRARTTLHCLEKTPTITPHVYSLLGASHELRIKQALAEGVARKKLDRFNMELSGLDEKSLSFHLDDDEDDLVSRGTTNMSNRNWITRSTRSPSRRSAMGSFRLDHDITMLKSKRRKNFDGTCKDLIIIKSSFTKDAPSKTPSTKSQFHNMFDSRPSSNSVLSYNQTEPQTTQFKKCIYLNAPPRSIELRKKDYKIVPILVNYQLQALVQTVIEVLERVNPEKLRKIMETVRDTDKIKEMLLRPEILNFAQSLLGQSLVSSPESFVVSVATVANEIDFRFGGILEKEIIALTLEVPSISPFDCLIAEIRRNIFHKKKSSRLNENAFLDKIFCARNKRRTEKENAEISLNAIPTDNKSKIKRFSNTGKNKNYARERSAKLQETSRNGENCIANKSREDNVEQGNDIKRSGSWRKTSKIKSVEQSSISGSNITKRASNFKTWKTARDHGHLDADHVILRRMTNPQRILVGQMCASLKARKINNQGLINESVPLAALIAPALSRDCIKFLTRGTVYTKINPINEQEEMENNVTVPDKLTGSLLAKIRQDMTESETKRRLICFLNKDVT
nr:PREDICTED: uncharacterized protein LOC100878949 isoform X2 [Megachile rotundata]